MKTSKDKQRLIEQFKKTPIVQISCEKTNIGRATYYRWLNSDQQFKEAAKKALEEGTELVNELAESQLISAIRDQNMTGIIFWLKNHHKAYKPRLELSGEIKTANEILDDEQKAIIMQALRMSNLLTDGDSPLINNPNNDDQPTGR